MMNLSRDNVNALNILMMNKPDLKIVISSCWRMGRTLGDLRVILKIAGFQRTEAVIDTVPIQRWKDKSGWCTRGEEIKDWLDVNDINKFVILDDDDDMVPFMDRLVLTDGDVGLTIDDINKVIDLLK